MTRIAGASVLFVMLTLTGACGVGGDDPMPGGGSGTPIPTIDTKRVCISGFTVTGTFTADTTVPRPTDPDTGLPLTGCWPVGTWTFTAAVDPNVVVDPMGPSRCSTTPAALSSYSFKVARTPDPAGGADTIQTLSMLSTLSGGMQYHLAMSSNGQGCEGSLEFGSADGSQYWNMKPTLSKDPAATAVGGGGDYTLYMGNGWPWQ